MFYASIFNNAGVTKYRGTELEIVSGEKNRIFWRFVFIGLWPGNTARPTKKNIPSTISINSFKICSLI